MNEPILKIENLSVAFRSENGITTAIDAVTFDLNKGEALGIVGESGSGKSVTSLAVMGLLPANTGIITGGRIVFTTDGMPKTDLAKCTESAMQKVRGRKISMIFQEPMTSLNPVMRCGRQLTESIRLHLGYSRRNAAKHAIAMFREVMLPDPERVFKAYPHQLSGGQKQRVMIAMALACQPDIVIADEPTTALDVTVQKTILTLLKSLQAKYGMSLIFISHDLGVIAEIASRVVVINQGKIVEQGDVHTVFNSPLHPYTKGLLACRPPLDQRPLRLPVVSDFMPSGGDYENPDFKIKYSTNADRAAFHQKLYAGEPLLKVNALSVHFSHSRSLFKPQKPNFKAVDNVSFSVYRGETLGLVVESGCGKTTLSRAILQLISPHNGSVLFDGKELTALNKEQIRLMRRRMQLIFQDPYSSLNPRITAGESIAEPMKVHNLYPASQRREKVAELLERVGLQPDHYRRYPHQFSGGQRQRICIARTLALNPEFIICDESVSALDVSVQAQVLNLLNDLKKEFGFTYIFISHDLSVVHYMSDRMLVMQLGKVVEYGETDQICSNPGQEYTRELLRAIPGNGFRRVH